MPTSYSRRERNCVRAQSVVRFVNTHRADAENAEHQLNDVAATFSPDKAHRGAHIFRRHVTGEHVHQLLQCLANAFAMNYVKHVGVDGGGGVGAVRAEMCQARLLGS